MAVIVSPIVTALPWLNVKALFGATGDGVTDDSTAFTKADAANGGTNVTEVPQGTYRISTNTTLNYIVDLPLGAKFSIDSGITLILNSRPQAGPYQIFFGLGKVTPGPGVVGVLPEWWGADRTGVVASDTAVLAAITTGKSVMLGGIYLMNGTTIPATVPGCHLYGHGEITGFKLANSANVPIFTMVGGIQHVSMRHLSIDGNQANQPANSPYYGLEIGNNNGVTSSDITIDDLTLKNGNQYALRIQTVQNCHVRGIRSTQWSNPVLFQSSAYDCSVSDVLAVLGPLCSGGSAAAPMAVTFDVLFGTSTYNCTVDNITAENGGVLFLYGCRGVTASALTSRGAYDIALDLELCCDCTITGFHADGTGSASSAAQAAWMRSCQRVTISGTAENFDGVALAIWGLCADIEANIKAINCATLTGGYAFYVHDIGYDDLRTITSDVATLLLNGQSVIGRNITLRGCSGGQGSQYGGFLVYRDIGVCRILLDGCVGYGTFPFNIFTDYPILQACRAVKPGQWGFSIAGSSYGSYSDCQQEFAPGGVYEPVSLYASPGVSAPAAPTLAHTPASTGLAAVATYVVLDAANGIGRTLPSAATSVTLVAGDNITFSENMPAEGLGIYVGTTSTPLLLGTVYADGHIVYSGTSTTGLSVTWTYNSTTTVQANVTITALASGTGAAALATRSDRIGCQHNRFSGFVADGRGGTYDYVLKEDTTRATLDGTHDYNLMDGTRSIGQTSGIASFQGTHSASVNAT